MKIPGADKAIANVIKWASRDEWSAAREDAVDEHLGEVCEECGIGLDDLPEMLGGDHFGMVMGCILEDFLTWRFDEEERNVVDDYLKRRGWRESVPGKRYLEALRDSVISLYEVADLDPGRTLTLRDLIRGGEPVTVGERLGSETAARWDRVAARVIAVNGQQYISGVLLLFPHAAADMVMEIFEGAAKKFRRMERKKKAAAEKPDGEAMPEWNFAPCCSGSSPMCSRGSG